MFGSVFYNLQGICIVRRCIHFGFSCKSRSQLQTALRPFIFSVHPDLFGQYPDQKRVNEDSLKVLNEYIQKGTESESKGELQKKLYFYQRVEAESDNPNKKAELKLLQVNLGSNVLLSVRKILLENGFPVEFIDSLINSREATKEQLPPNVRINWIRSQYFATTGKEYPFADVWDEVNTLRSTVTLHRWVTDNINEARQLEKESQLLRQECHKLTKNIISTYGLLDIRWDCGWRGSHQLASLRKLKTLINNDKLAEDIVKERKVVFGNESGVLFNGDVVLSIEQVPQQWIETVQYAPSTDKVVASIPIAEERLSKLLGGIQIVHKAKPPLPTARDYYNSVASLISRLGMAHSLFEMGSLEHLQLQVAGGASDELILSPEGHICVPSGCPVWAVKGFLKDKRKTAEEKISQYKIDKKNGEQLIKKVIDEYELQDLKIDNSITWDRVVECCENLLIDFDSVRYLLKGMRVCIAPYFTVTHDGELCILWNWANNSSHKKY